MEESTIQVLLNRLQQMTEEVRDSLLEMNGEEFEQFVVKRENVVEQLEPYRTTMSDANKQRIGIILSHDSEILHRMYALQDEAGKWLEKRGSIREQKQAYQQAYAIDSMFIDHRK